VRLLLICCGGRWRAVFLCISRSFFFIFFQRALSRWARACQRASAAVAYAQRVSRQTARPVRSASSPPALSPGSPPPPTQRQQRRLWQLPPFAALSSVEAGAGGGGGVVCRNGRQRRDERREGNLLLVLRNSQGEGKRDLSGAGGGGAGWRHGDLCVLRWGRGATENADADDSSPGAP